MFHDFVGPSHTDVQGAALDCRCVLHQRGPVVIVLQPARVVSDTELSAAGLTTDEISDFRTGQLSLPSHENIQVIGQPQDLSYTSYQANFAHIEMLQVARKASGPVRITLRRRRDHIAITDLR